MSEQSPEKLRITAITPTQAAKILSAAGSRGITEAMICADIDSGAPVNADGTINLVYYTAWLVKQAASGGSKKDAIGGSKGESNGN